MMKVPVATRQYLWIRKLGQEGTCGLLGRCRLPRKHLQGPPETGRLSCKLFSPISRGRNPMAPQKNPKMAQHRPRAAPDSARFRSRVCQIWQGCDPGQICLPTIVVKDICTADSHQECLFDLLPAGHLFFSSVPTKSNFNKSSPDGRCSLFKHTSRFVHAVLPAPLSAPS